MKHIYSFVAFFLISAALFAQNNSSSTTVFDEILFYDGYAATVNEPVPTDVIRHRNDLYAKKLTDTELDSFGDKLSLDITLRAACDNYDRIGNVNIAFVDKGDASYTPEDVERIEIARFITPFMNKNISPNEVPYSFIIDNVAQILTNEDLRQEYDFWVEFEIFGVPYAAQEQVAGCSDRNDTFYGTLTFNSSFTNQENDDEDFFFMPLSQKTDLNKYNATDVEGETTRIIDFELTEDVNNAKFYLITSNHGANTGGEEYVRRQHYVYLNDELIHDYKPGGKSCEPFRQYNTQGNGIYGPSPQSESWWTSWNNWCPGDVIPIRVIDLGDLEAGSYTFKLDVPAAVFNDDQGYIPVSLYLENRDQELMSNKEFNHNSELVVYPNPTRDFFRIKTNFTIETIELYNSNGQQVLKKDSYEENDRIDVSKLSSGIYFSKFYVSNQATPVISKLIIH